jgi:hypothetical protein
MLNHEELVINQRAKRVKIGSYVHNSKETVSKTKPYVRVLVTHELHALAQPGPIRTCHQRPNIR